MAANLNGGTSDVAKQLVDQLKNQDQAQLQNIKQQNHDATTVQGPNFSNQLQQSEAARLQQNTKIQQVGQVATQKATSTDVLRAGKAQIAQPSQKIGATEKGEESKLAGMIDNLVNGQDKMTKIMQMALSGRQFGPSELLAMQAGVYRYSQELDLTSKVVQQATSGIKQTLNTQV